MISMLYSWYSSTDGNGAMLLECYYSTLRKCLILYTTTFDSEALVVWDVNVIADFFDLSSAKSQTRSAVLVLLGVACDSIRGTSRDKHGPWLIQSWWFNHQRNYLKKRIIQIKEAVGDIANQSRADKLQLNESKCKEMRISFSKMEMK